MMRNRSKLLGPALLGALLLACNGETPAPETAPAPSEPAVAETEPEEKLEPRELERSDLADAQVPFVLKLEGSPKTPPDSGTVELVAEIEAKKELGVPATITVELPEGAKLVGGQGREELSKLPAGVTTRHFEVSYGAPLTGPIAIAVDVVDPGGAFGAHAKRVYPKAAADDDESSSRVPAPPGGRPGAGRRPKRASDAAPSRPGTR